MAFELLSTGTATPEHFIDQGDAAELAASLTGPPGERRTLTALYRRTKVNTRRSVLLEGSTNGQPANQSFYAAAESTNDGGPTTATRMQRYETEASKLATEAAARAVDAAGIDASDLKQLVTVSCSGFRAPGVDIDLIANLQFDANVGRTHIGFMGCHGALNGLRVAHALAAARPGDLVMLCAVELCSLHQQYGQVSDQIVANALFADGAAAVIGRVSSAVTPTQESWKLVSSGSTVIPNTQELMHWQIRDNGFEMALSPKVPDVIHDELRPWVASWLMKHDLRVEEIESWAIHPGGPKILQSTGEALQLSQEQLQPSWDIFSEYGNMSSPTVLFIVEHLRSQQASLPCVSLAFGPGLTVEAALWK